MTLDEDLVQAVDRVSKQLRYDIEQLENKHRRGYERYPVNVEEFSVWEDEHAWGDE
jgi:hypothetical protein